MTNDISIEDGYAAVHGVNAIARIAGISLPFSPDEKVSIGAVLNQYPDIDWAQALRALRIRALDNKAEPFRAYTCAHGVCSTIRAISAK